MWPAGWSSSDPGCGSCTSPATRTTRSASTACSGPTWPSCPSRSPYASWLARSGPSWTMPPGRRGAPTGAPEPSMMDTTTSRRNIVTHASNDETHPVVLVADDEGAIRDLVSEVLTKAGFQPVVVHDGEAIPELARQHRPVAILLDVMMPRMDGFTVVTR